MYDLPHFSTYAIGRSALLDGGIGKSPLQQATEDLATAASNGLISPLERLALEDRLSSFPTLTGAALAQANDLLQPGRAMAEAAKSVLHPLSLTDQLLGG